MALVDCYNNVYRLSNHPRLNVQQVKDAYIAILLTPQYYIWIFPLLPFKNAMARTADVSESSLGKN